MLKLTFKVSTGPSFDLTLEPTATVADVKKAAAAPSGIPEAQQRLIYKGRILKDTETLQQHAVETGHTLHLVKGPGAPAAPAAATVPAPSATAQSTPAPAAAQHAHAHPTNRPIVPPTTQAFPGAQQAAAPGGNMASMLGNPGMQGMMAQMMAAQGGATPAPGMDPAMMAGLMQTPMFQQMMQTMASNPQLMAQMVQSNPMMQQAVAQNPQLGVILQNPELLRILMNPQTMQAILSLQQAMATAQPAAPAAGGNNYAAMMQAMSQNPMLAQMLANEEGSPVAAPLGAEAAAELSQRFAGELTQMEMMGFVDRNANLEALRVCDGNVEQAINYLLSYTGHQ